MTVKKIAKRGWKITVPGVDGAAPRIEWTEVQETARKFYDQGAQVEPWAIPLLIVDSYERRAKAVQNGEGTPRYNAADGDKFQIIKERPFVPGWRIGTVREGWSWTEDKGVAWSAHKKGFIVEGWAVQGHDEAARGRAVYLGVGRPVTKGEREQLKAAMHVAEMQEKAAEPREPIEAVTIQGECLSFNPTLSQRRAISAYHGELSRPGVYPRCSVLEDVPARAAASTEACVLGQGSGKTRQPVAWRWKTVHGEWVYTEDAAQAEAAMKYGRDTRALYE